MRDWRETAERHAQCTGAANESAASVLRATSRLPDDAIITADSGSSAVWLARQVADPTRHEAVALGRSRDDGLRVSVCARRQDRVSGSRRSIAVIGDGAMQMSGMSALIDVAKYWKQWSDPRFIVLVLNNRDLNYVTWEQRVMEGDPKYERSQNLPDDRLRGLRRAAGLRGMRIDSPERVGAAWDEAFASDRPVLIDAIVNADVPTLPPELTKEQKEHLAKAIADGDPDARGDRDAARGAGDRRRRRVTGDGPSTPARAWSRVVVRRLAAG